MKSNSWDGFSLFHVPIKSQLGEAGYVASNLSTQESSKAGRWGQPGLYNTFQGSQGYTVRPSLKNKQQQKSSYLGKLEKQRTLHS